MLKQPPQNRKLWVIIIIWILLNILLPHHKIPIINSSSNSSNSLPWQMIAQSSILPRRVRRFRRRVFMIFWAIMLAWNSSQWTSMKMSSRDSTSTPMLIRCRSSLMNSIHKSLRSFMIDWTQFQALLVEITTKFGSSWLSCSTVSEIPLLTRNTSLSLWIYLDRWEIE